jgi:serine/threonine protein kinase
MIIKEVRPHNWKWRDPTYWRDYLPREIRVHQKIDAKRPGDGKTLGHGNLLRHRGYRLMMRQRRYKLYLDFREGGDLYQGLKEHFERWKKRQAAGSTERLKIIPESLVWHVFSQLVDGCLVLQMGSIPPSTDPTWQPIAHLDISLANVFLEPPVEDEYPNCVLSDFGMAMYEMQQRDPESEPADNPQEYVLGHTSFKYPPEQQIVRGTYPDLTPLNEETDIWAIGAAIWYLIANRVVIGPHRELHFPDDMPRNVNVAEEDTGRLDALGATPFSGVEFPALEKHSPELKALVARCLNWEQEHRPSLNVLRAEINTFLGNHPEVRDSRNYEPLRMPILEDGLKVGDTFVRKRRQPAHDDLKRPEKNRQRVVEDEDAVD